MAKPKSPEQLRQELARVFFDQTQARRYYGLEEAVTTLETVERDPACRECFGGSLRGGMYIADLREALQRAFTGADQIVAVLREQPDAALELVAGS